MRANVNAALLVALLCASISIKADFYEEGAAGWFWYVDPTKDTPEPEPEAPSVQSPPERLQQVEAPRVEPGPPPLSSAWFRENLDRFKDRALDDPTPANVELFFLLQKAMMDKAERFSRVSEQVVVGHAALDEVGRRPITNLGANLANRAAGDNRDEVLRRIARSVAIWFFYRSDCPYCEAQAPLLQLLEQHYGFTVLAISMDGLPMPGGFYPDFILDGGQGQALGVTSTPSMFLVHPATGDVSGLGRGLLSLAELRDRTVISATRAGWIDETTADTTRAVAGAPTLDTVAPEAPEDPMALLEYLKQREREQRRAARLF